MGFENIKFISEISIDQKKVKIFSLKALEKITGKSLQKLPISIKILLEQVLRHQDNNIITKKDIQNLI